jgi:hypothetical protein
MLMRVVSLGFAMFASSRDVTGSGSCIYDKGYYLIIKSYSSLVVGKFTRNVQVPRRNSDSHLVFRDPTQLRAKKRI